jgi:hypothetical protein
VGNVGIDSAPLNGSETTGDFTQETVYKIVHSNAELGLCPGNYTESQTCPMRDRQSYCGEGTSAWKFKLGIFHMHGQRKAPCVPLSILRIFPTIDGLDVCALVDADARPVNADKDLGMDKGSK